ncbi:MAG TPA: hypothetical protein VL137_09625 [Polyangiaceae bacterium]|nr:hypothetical protein [Polyangiaceae bacterium]
MRRKRSLAARAFQVDRTPSPFGCHFQMSTPERICLSGGDVDINPGADLYKN